uniref:Phorbol-ester/DAG-type domain-containing protein n=1 Tax=Anopheles atroparvus TaxID=41427 RepID=A0A182JH96_ANOAO
MCIPDCDVNCHKKCEKLAANLCGVNQKLIVEALSSVRRDAQSAHSANVREFLARPASASSAAVEHLVSLANTSAVTVTNTYPPRYRTSDRGEVRLRFLA